MDTGTTLDPSPARAPEVSPLTDLLRSLAAWARARWSDLGAQPVGRRVPCSVTVSVVVLVIGALASIVSVSSEAGITYRDEQLHLSIARRLFDSATPGFQQLGTVWLPVPHLILAPFVIDFGWWVSGAGAAIVGTVCLAASASALYRIIARMRGARTARLVTVAAFVSSPAVLYVFTTPLTEPVLIAGLLGCVAGLFASVLIGYLVQAAIEAGPRAHTMRVGELDAQHLAAVAALDPVTSGERMMTARILPAEVPEQVRLEADGRVMHARIEVEGGLAARGQAAVRGGDVVFDRIETMPEFRRRGLGALVMTGLSAWAAGSGATTGLLMASVSGRRLYESLGWSVVAPIITLRGRAPAPAPAAPRWPGSR